MEDGVRETAGASSRGSPVSDGQGFGFDFERRHPGGFRVRRDMIGLPCEQTPFSCCPGIKLSGLRTETRGCCSNVRGS